MSFAVYHEGHGARWETYDWLKNRCTEFDTLCSLYEETEGEEGVDREDYQSDSPYANFITGYDTDSYADESIAILRNGWDYYLEDCEVEEVTPTVDGYLDTVWEDFDYQLLHTWLRVTNLRMNDNEIVTFARECDRGQITEWLKEGRISPPPCAS